MAFGAKLKALGSTLGQSLGATEPSALFETLVLSEPLPDDRLPKTMRDLQRRCRTFSESIEQYLVDQSPPPEPNSFDAAQRVIGVIVAMIDRPAVSVSDGVLQEGPQ